MRYSERLRNAGLDARIEAIGPHAVLQIVASSEVVAMIQLPAVWMTKARNGSVHKLGNWAALARTTGEVVGFRICDAAGGVQIRGDIPADMTLKDGPRIEANQSVVVGEFTITAGNG